MPKATMPCQLQKYGSSATVASTCITSMKLVVPILNLRCRAGSRSRGAITAARCRSSRVSAVCEETKRILLGLTKPLRQENQGADGAVSDRNLKELPHRSGSPRCEFWRWPGFRKA